MRGKREATRGPLKLLYLRRHLKRCHQLHVGVRMYVYASLAVCQEKEVVLDVPRYFVHLELKRLLPSDLLRLEINECH